MSDHSQTEQVDEGPSPDDFPEPIVWEMRYEQRFTPNGRWYKRVVYLYGDLEQVTGFVRGWNQSSNVSVFSLKARFKINRLYDLTIPNQ